MKHNKRKHKNLGIAYLDIEKIKSAFAKKRTVSDTAAGTSGNSSNSSGNRKPKAKRKPPPPQQQQQTRHRYRPGERARLEIRRYQRSTEFLIQRLLVKRLP